MPDSQYYKSLHRSMAITVVLVSLMPLALITLIGGYQYTEIYKAKVMDHLEEIVRKHEQNIDSYLLEKVGEIRVLSDTMGPECFRDENKLETLHKSLMTRHGGDFVDLGLINSQGIQVAYSGPFRLGLADYSTAEWFRQVKKRKVYISDVFLGLRGIPHFIIAVLFESGGKEWVLRTTIDFVSFNELVENISIGRTGLAFIINERGEFQTKPRIDLSAEVPFLKELLRKATAGGKSATPFSGKRVSDMVVSTIGPNPLTGQETIFLSTPLKQGDWLLVYQQDSVDAFSDLSHTRNLALIVLLIGVVAITFVAFYLSKRMVKRIVAADKEKEMMNEQVIEAGRLASLGELAAGIAHEINNPVAIMVEEAGWVQDLLAEGLDKEGNMDETKRALVQIRTQGSRCREITHKLLSFARMIDPTTMELQLNELVEEIIGLSSQRTKYAAVQVETELDPALPTIAASPSEMQQVLLNLVNNAVDAMEKDGGTLTITTKRDRDDVLMTVADTGCGIPKANIQRLFDPFFTTKPVGKGTGLGLSIIYGIINKMNGEISVNSAVDVGTAFTVRIPSAAKSGLPAEADGGNKG
ncbi:sensor histidine kinase [Salidesulfovibrio onnuriiensis]|uniref:sensor histidine kinase n=1 Tax=Salidesulfovibrio onnuriiensis TaxID=2583823 RepID=UPI0011C71452|nr:PAS domain-containing sensor histidine kinase [Salidesulfovibrio onnuriiensis]